MKCTETSSTSRGRKNSLLYEGEFWHSLEIQRWCFQPYVHDKMERETNGPVLPVSSVACCSTLKMEVMFLRNVKLRPNYIVLKHERPHSSLHTLQKSRFRYLLQNTGIQGYCWKPISSKITNPITFKICVEMTMVYMTLLHFQTCLSPAFTLVHCSALSNHKMEAMSLRNVCWLSTEYTELYFRE
jgi:hypothetical protein